LILHANGFCCLVCAECGAVVRLLQRVGVDAQGGRSSTTHVVVGLVCVVVGVVVVVVGSVGGDEARETSWTCNGLRLHNHLTRSCVTSPPAHIHTRIGIDGVVVGVVVVGSFILTMKLHGCWVYVF